MCLHCPRKIARKGCVLSMVMAPLSRFLAFTACIVIFVCIVKSVCTSVCMCFTHEQSVACIINCILIYIVAWITFTYCYFNILYMTVVQAKKPCSRGKPRHESVVYVPCISWCQQNTVLTLRWYQYWCKFCMQTESSVCPSRRGSLSRVTKRDVVLTWHTSYSLLRTVYPDSARSCVTRIRRSCDVTVLW
jgi:hypothetical protein